MTETTANCDVCGVRLDRDNDCSAAPSLPVCCACEARVVRALGFGHSDAEPAGEEARIVSFPQVAAGERVYVCHPTEFAIVSGAARINGVRVVLDDRCPEGIVVAVDGPFDANGVAIHDTREDAWDWP